MAHYHMEDIQAIVATGITPRRFQPGRRTILVAVLLSFLLLMSQIFSSLHINKPPHLSVSSIHQSLENVNEDADPPSCMKNYLGRSRPQQDVAGSCRHLTPPRGFCSLMQELFFREPPQSCSRQKEIIFCRQLNGKIECSLPGECKDRNIFIGVFSSHYGRTLWMKTVFSDLESKLNSIVLENTFKGYLFIKCSENLSNESEEDDGETDEVNYSEEERNDDPTQLYLHLPLISEMKTEIQNMTVKNININLVMVDSLSRNHLFRSLPATVEALDKLKDSVKHTVVDFEYVQSIKQRTYENLQALFSGYVNITDKPFGTYSLPKAALPLNVLLKRFKAKGYTSLWLEDLCWNWEWGLSKDLKVFNKTLNAMEMWINFEKATREAMIDNVDVTLASCEILKLNDKKDPFHNIPSVCFNGKYHHEYLLEYLQMYQQGHRLKGKQFFSLIQTNVAHEESGIRVQSLDKHLKNYLKYAETLNDTLTILFSDHGNTYGSLIEKSSEGYVETFNPFLIFIIPNHVKSIIGDVRMKNLIENEHRLVSYIDVHETLLTLIDETNNERDEEFRQKYVLPDGLFRNVPLQRTCRDIPLVLPNLCICKNFDISVSVESIHYALAEFSVGVLNNLILRQRGKYGKRGFGKCQLLHAKKIRTVRVSRKTADVVHFNLDIVVSNYLTDDEELFVVAVEVLPKEPSVRLLSYERISVYGKFEGCKDKSVDIKLCICEMEKPRSSSMNFFNSFLWPSFLSSYFTNSESENEFSKKQLKGFFDSNQDFMKTYIDKAYPPNDPCLYVIRHEYQEGFNIFGINLCSSIQKVILTFRYDNLFLSDHSQSNYLLRFLDMKHLIIGIKANSKLDWHWSYDIKVV